MKIMMATVRRLPVVVILGATGTGKSKLAIEIGRKFNGEIISADSMQIYKGLDIITNKVTSEEQLLCRHHLLSYVDPFTTTTNTVVDFRDAALPLIDRLLEGGKLPIIVGGTNYYIESLLWNLLIDKRTVDAAKNDATASKRARLSETSGEEGLSKSASSTDANFRGSDSVQSSSVPPSDIIAKSNEIVVKLDSDGLAGSVSEAVDAGQARTVLEAEGKCSSGADGRYSGTDGGTGHGSAGGGSSGRSKELKTWADELKKFNGMETAALHNKLKSVDPLTALKIHPHNRRKIIRALQVYEEHGVPMSDILKRQHESVGRMAVSGPLRYTHTCIFWIQCDQQALDQRLDARVEGMMEQGLLNELHAFHRRYKQEIAERQRDPNYTMGIFQSIGFKEFHDYLLLPEDERDTVKGRELKIKGIEALKLATRQYARKQIKWIRSRFLKRAGPNVPPVYGLNSSDVSRWTELVFDPASDILSSILQGETPSTSPIKMEENTIQYVHNVCDVCGGRVFTTQLEWESHLSGHKHRRALGKQRKLLRRLGVKTSEETEAQSKPRDTTEESTNI